MFRSMTVPVLLAAFFWVGQPSANAQWPPLNRPVRNLDLAGTYINQTNGAECFVYVQGRGFVFVNENGSRARFVFVGQGRLQQTEGEWDPNVVATISRDRVGRTVLRFDSLNSPPGIWLSAP